MEEFKKVLLTIMLLAMVYYCYSVLLMKDLNKKIENGKKELVELQRKIGDAQTQINRTKEIETASLQAEETIAFFKEYMPEGSPIAWFPPKAAAFFERHGIERATTRLGNPYKPAVPTLGAYSIFPWVSRLDKVGFIQLGIALSALENNQPLLEITTLSILSSQEDPEFQNATVGMTMLLNAQ